MWNVIKELEEQVADCSPLVQSCRIVSAATDGCSCTAAIVTEVREYRVELSREGFRLLDDDAQHSSSNPAVCSVFESLIALVSVQEPGSFAAALTAALKQLPHTEEQR